VTQLRAVTGPTAGEIRRRLLRAVLLLLGVAVVGTAGYVVLEGWTLVEAAYMTAITLTTVGFMEVHPLSPAGRVFTIVLLVGGVTVFFYLIGAFGEFVVSGQLRDYLRGRRMREEIDGLRDHYIVCGFGRVGRQVAADVESWGGRCVVITLDPAQAERLDAVLHVIGDATRDEVLQAAGIERAAGLVVSTQDDAANVFITLTARALNPSIVIVARSNLASTDQKLRTAGATHIISPYSIAGRRIATQLLYPSITAFLDELVNVSGTDLSLDEVRVRPNSALAGATLSSAGVRSRIGANVIAVRRPGAASVVTNPPADYAFAPDDVLVVLATPEQLDELAALAGDWTS
jgi:voltage-gated potassium channel